MLLTADRVRVSFGGVRAVDDVTLSLASTEIVGIVGPNGSGKTSFLNAITGVVEAMGRLVVAGRDVPLGRPAAARAAGVLRLFQTPQTYRELSCIENVLVAVTDRSLCRLGGAWAARPWMWRRERRRWDLAHRSLQRVGLEDLALRSAAMLPYGQQRMLDLARALAAEPTVLLLDEPSAGLNQYETEQLGELCRGLRADGMSLMVIDHKVDFIESISDRVAVFNLGTLIADAPPREVWNDERVVAAYLGTARHRA